MRTPYSYYAIVLLSNKITTAFDNKNTLCYSNYERIIQNKFCVILIFRKGKQKVHKCKKTETEKEVYLEKGQEYPCSGDN